MLILDSKTLSKLNFCYDLIKELTKQSKVIYKQYRIKKPILIIDNEVKIACYYIGDFTIAINNRILELNSKAKIRQIITHEFCHHIMYYIDGCKNKHGKQFNECCRIFKIPAGPELIIRTKKGEKLK